MRQRTSKAKLRILILNYEYPPIGGGGGVISKAIAQGLFQNGHVTTVVTTWFEGLVENEQDQGVEVIRIKSKRKSMFRSNPMEMLSWILECKKFLPTLMIARKFDLCLANFALPGGEVALFLKKKYSVPFFVLSHGHDIPWVKPYWQLVPLHLLAYRRLKKICMESEKNFVQSAAMLQNINKFLGPLNTSKNIKIPNGLETKGIQNKRSSQRQLRAIFVGRLVKQKDPRTLFRAIKKINDDQIDFSLDVYGDGLLRSKLERYVKKKMPAARINFHGKVSRKKMLQAYRSADLMIAPSISEGMSISILEALSWGIYVITTKVSGNDEIIECKVNGDFVDAENDTMLYNAIRAYYFQKHKLGYKVPASFLKRFKAKYDWSTIVPIYEREFKTIKESVKVLHVIDTLWLGGAQTLLKTLFESKSITEQDYLFALRKTKPSIRVDNKQVEVYRSSSRWSPFPIYRLFTIIKNRDIKVLHCHLPRSQVFGFILKLLFPKIKLVYHEHGDLCDKGWVLPLLIRLFQKKVDLFVPVSGFLKETLQKKIGVPVNKISVLCNCVENCLLKEKHNPKHNPMIRDLEINKKDSFIVGFAGRLIERKGWDDFLRVAKMTIESNSGSRILFLIAGIGPDMQKVKSKILKLDLTKHVICLGYVEEMSRFYSLIDCCVMTSRWEGLPLVQLESMSYGVPLIMYNGPGMNEVSGGNFKSLYVAKGDVKGLSEKLLLLKDNLCIRQEIEKQSQKFVFKMNPNKYYSDLESLYSSIL